MCSGRIDPEFIMEAFAKGADGVLIGGCHPGDCHYAEGNYKCLRRFKLMQKYIAQMGIDNARLRLEWISASEGKRLQEVVNEMTAQLRELGPSTIKEVVQTLDK
jgi:F420-non-reducing hydrogenase iron-sulfur subunit